MYRHKRYPRNLQEFIYGDSVMVLYKKKDNVKGFITETQVFNGKLSRCRIHRTSTWYPIDRILSIRVVLVEKHVINVREW